MKHTDPRIEKEQALDVHRDGTGEDRVSLAVEAIRPLAEGKMFGEFKNARWSHIGDLAGAIVARMKWK